MRRLVGVVAVLVVLLCACGGSEESGGIDASNLNLGLPGQELFPGPNAGRGAGNPVPDDNVVGGVDVDIDRLPWTVALLYTFDRKDNFCGGVLVDPTTVLSAAHCLDVSKDVGKPTFLGPELIEVLPGRSRLDAETARGVSVERVRIAEGWDGEGFGWDYAILDLAEPIDKNPVKLPDPGDVALWQEGALVVAAGWGCQRAQDLLPNESCEDDGGSPLKAAWQSVQDPSQCSSGFDEVTELCLMAEDSSGTTCAGDSGGPHVVLGPDDLFYLVGLVSYGPVSCRPGSYDVAAFVPRILYDSTHLSGEVKYRECFARTCSLPDRTS